MTPAPGMIFSHGSVQFRILAVSDTSVDWQRVDYPEWTGTDVREHWEDGVAQGRTTITLTVECANFDLEART